MKKPLIIFLGILFFSGQSFSQDVPHVDSALAESGNRFLIFPFFLKSPETNWGFGGVSAYFFKPAKGEQDIRTSDVNLVTLYTLRNQVVIVLGSTVFFSKEKTILRLQASYSYYPDKCWGLGNNSLSDAQEEYSIHQYYFNPQYLKKFFRHWYAGISFDLQHIGDFKYVPGGVFDQQQITGRFGGNTSGLGFLFTYDTRNNAYSPSKGFFMELNSTGYNKILGSDFNFTTLTFDLRSFFSFSKKQVLAMQLLLKDNTESVPIRNMALLGGPEMMRGYYKGRFTDNDLIAFQSELRQHLFWRIGATVFGAVGEVANSVVDFIPEELHYTYGAGLRIMVSQSEKLNLRVDAGFGKKSSGLYVILKEAF
jgi:outer membrane protein assembly factor BamA